MNLVMLDVDGTLTQSFEYDKDVFGLAIGEVLGCPPIDADLNGYIHKTSLGVTEEAIQRVTGRSSTPKEIEEVKSKVLGHMKRLFRESPQIFQEVPGAARFLKRLRKLDEVGIAIATGGWYSEALFKLGASGLNVAGIPIASSDDDRSRTKIMKIAVERARESFAAAEFQRVVYLGDGPWDVQEAHQLGYGFIGIGPRVHGLMVNKTGGWHQDFTDMAAVFDSISAVLKSTE